jgi:hypothetical protein
VKAKHRAIPHAGKDDPHEQREHDQAAEGVVRAPSGGPIDDAPGDREPGFGGEGHRSELGDGKPIDPGWRKRFEEHNRRVTPKR